MVDVNLLRTFLAVVDSGGFHAAAEVLYSSQPSVSRQIRRLEAELGVRLLDRGPWGIRLTSNGVSFLPAARRTMREIELLPTSVSRTGSETIRMGAAATAAGSFLAPFLSHWIPQHPELRITMLEDGAAALRGRLERHECDIALLAAPIPAQFEHRFITTVTVQALIPPGHVLDVPEEPLDVRQLHAEPALINGSPFLSTELFSAACRLASSEPKIVYQSGVGQTLAALAEAGVGIAVLGDSVDLRGFELSRRPVTDADGRRLSFDLHMSWAGEVTLSSRVELLIEELSAFASLPPPLRRRRAPASWHRSGVSSGT